MKELKLYAITLKETGELLDPKSFRKYWPNYGGNQLYGWRPAKKIYNTLSRAKAGFNFIPHQIKKDVEISVFVRDCAIVDGEDLVLEQRRGRIKRDISRFKRILKTVDTEYREQYLQRLQDAEERLRTLESENSI